MSLLKIYRKKYILIFFILLCGLTTRSQDFFLGLFAGESNYSGDLQEKAFTFTQAHPAFGLDISFELNEKFIVRGNFMYGRVSAHDKYGTKNQSRNLSFYSNISEYSIALEYTFLDLYQYKFSPYIFTGIALYDFNPYTKDINDNIIYLPELSTEGQGFYNGRKDYKLRQVSIPYGGGIQWAINDNKRICISVGFRKTFTDYLDDVSTTYVDENILALNRGQKSANIAYRGDELTNGPAYPPDGTIRGNPGSKDLYYFTGLTFRVRLLPRKKVREFRFDVKKARRSSMECPKIF